MNKFGPDDLYFPVCFRDPVGRSSQEKYIRALKRLDVEFLAEVELISGDVSVVASKVDARRRPGLYNLSTIVAALRRNCGPGESPIFRKLVDRFGHTPWLPLAFDIHSGPVMFGEERNVAQLSSTFLWYWPQYLEHNLYCFWYCVPLPLSEVLPPLIRDFELGPRVTTAQQLLLDVQMLSAKRRLGPPPSQGIS